MKTSTHTLIMLGLLAGTAQAQTSVGIYGIVDGGITGERGSAATKTKITSGAAAASRIGFKGTEELGDGMSAFFILETGVKIDTGALDAENTIFNRQALVGLKTRAGSVTIGRLYTPWHAALAAIVDPFGTGYAGTSKNLFPDSGTNIRTSNTVMYTSPVLSGVSAELAYSAGERSSDSSAGRQFGGSIGYAGGPLVLRLAHNNKNTDLPLVNGQAAGYDTGRNTLLAASYLVKGIKLHAGYGIDKGYNAAPIPNASNPFGGVAPTASTDGRSALLGVTAPLGNGTLLFSVMHKDDKTAFNQDASAWGVAYMYHLSRRTGLYAAYAHVNNKNGAGYTVNNNSETGSGNTGYNLGVRHTF